MRTTIDIPEDLLRRTKAAAALRGLSLKDLVREALQRLLADTRQGRAPAQGHRMDRVTLSPECTFPLITGEPGPAMRDLRGGGAQRLLDEEDVAGVVDRG